MLSNFDKLPVTSWYTCRHKFERTKDHIVRIMHEEIPREIRLPLVIAELVMDFTLPHDGTKLRFGEIDHP